MLPGFSEPWICDNTKNGYLRYNVTVPQLNSHNTISDLFFGDKPFPTFSHHGLSQHKNHSVLKIFSKG